MVRSTRQSGGGAALWALVLAAVVAHGTAAPDTPADPSARDTFGAPETSGALDTPVGPPTPASVTPTSGEPLRCLDSRCSYAGGKKTEHQYKITGKLMSIDYQAGVYLAVNCHGAALLEPALAGLLSAERPSSVARVTLSKCPLPASGSLADVLAALDITLLASAVRGTADPAGCLTLDQLPREPRLTAHHFRGLEYVPALHLTATADARVQPERGFLEPLLRLEVLTARYVALEPDELVVRNATLHTLRLHYTGVTRLPAALLASSALRRVTLESARALDAGPLPLALEELDLRSPNTSLLLDALPVPSLRTLLLTSWNAMSPPVLAQCGSLGALWLSAPAARHLPPGWLADCVRLESLELQNVAGLATLPADMLPPASALTLLSCISCALASLPEGLLHCAPRLRELKLVRNEYLRTLPSGMFTLTPDVQVLDLSSNDLDHEAVKVLAPLRRLTHLNLDDNPRIGDLCDTSGKSPLYESTELTQLSLRSTAVSHICVDWRRDMRSLALLDLMNTNISRLLNTELQFERNGSNGTAWVLLDGAQVRSVELAREEYALALGWKAAPLHVTGLIKLACDCNMYWTRRALDAPNAPLRHLAGMFCADDRALAAVRPDDLLCTDDDTTKDECAKVAPPTGCTCGSRPHSNASGSDVVVQLKCEGRGLRTVPQLPVVSDAGRHYELLLTHNNITELPPAALRPDVQILDLRYNSLTALDEETVAQLDQLGGALQLAGNPLECSCRAEPLVQALRSLGGRADLALATCAGGRPLTEAAASCPPVAAWATLAAAALLALSLAALLLLASPERRFFLKAVLHRLGCVWYDPDPHDDATRPYDAFLTFSHKDLPAALELVARLEPTYQLCVHYRDWVPGRYISEQVEESVRNSRRTVALVSRHFLASGWALAEFRQAHQMALLDARPRLVVVLLEDPAELTLDEQLARYLATKTYVRWGDAFFWDKLALALPRPRAPPTAAPSSTRPSCAPPATLHTSRAPPATARPSRAPAAPASRRNVSTIAASPAVPTTLTLGSENCPVPDDTVQVRDLKRVAWDMASHLRQVAPEVWEVTAELRPVTPELRPVTPEVRDVTLDVRDVTHNVRDVTLNLRDVIPQVRKVTPEVQDVIPEVRELTPEVRSVTPEVRNVKLDVRDLTAEVRNVTLDVWDVIPKVRNVTLEV